MRHSVPKRLQTRSTSTRGISRSRSATVPVARPSTDTKSRSRQKRPIALGAEASSRDGIESSPTAGTELETGTEADVAPAAIEYVGLPGISKECQDAVLRLLQFGDHITHVRILSAANDHCLLLTVNVGDIVAVKSGFASGYLGEGSRTFSYVLKVLEAHGAEIEEYRVDPEIIQRVDSSALTAIDLKAIDSSRPLRPRRWNDYVFENHWDWKEDGTLWREFPYVIPFAIIDKRLIDLAVSFWDGPDDRLLTGYRRLEDIVRSRTNIPEHGSKLFAQAFGTSGGRLTWPDIDGAEHAGRLSLFTGTYMAYRNRRAHRETQDDASNLLGELMLLNELYRLESLSVERPGSS